MRTVRVTTGWATAVLLALLTTLGPLSAQVPAPGSDTPYPPQGNPSGGAGAGWAQGVPRAFAGRFGDTSSGPVSWAVDDVVLVAGQVPKPGLYPFSAGLTVAKALAQAGARLGPENRLAIASCVGQVAQTSDTPAGVVSTYMEAPTRFGTLRELSSQPLSRMDIVVALPDAAGETSGLAVVGEVKRPVVVPLAVGGGAQQPVTLADALDRAGGLLPSAYPKRLLYLQAGEPVRSLSTQVPSGLWARPGAVLFVPRLGQVPLAEEDLLRPLDLDLESVTLEQAFRRMAEAAGGGVTVQLDPAIRPSTRNIHVQATLRGMPLRLAVQDLAHKANLQVATTPTGFRILPQTRIEVVPAPREATLPVPAGPGVSARPPSLPTRPGGAAAPWWTPQARPPVADLGAPGRKPVTVQFQGTPVREALTQLLSSAGVPFALGDLQSQTHPVWNQPLSISLGRTPLQVALRAIAETAGLQATREDGVLRVMPWLPSAAQPAPASAAGGPSWRLIVRAVAVNDAAAQALSNLAVREPTGEARTITPEWLRSVLPKGAVVQASPTVVGVWKPGQPMAGTLALGDRVIQVRVPLVEGGERTVRVSYEILWGTRDRSGRRITLEGTPLRGVTQREVRVARALPSGRPGVYLLLTVLPE